MVKKEILKRTVVVSMTLLLAGMFTGCSSEEADVTGDTSTEKIVSMSSEEIEEESTEASTEDIESSLESSEEETNQEESNEDTTVAEGSDEQMVADKGVSNSAEVVETTPVQPVVETPAPTQPAPTQPVQQVVTPAPTQPVQQVVTPVETKPVATQPATQPQVVETAPVQTQPVTQPQTQPATQPQVVETTPVQTQPATQPQTQPAPTQPVTQPQTQPVTQPQVVETTPAPTQPARDEYAEGVQVLREKYKDYPYILNRIDEMSSVNCDLIGITVWCQNNHRQIVNGIIDIYGNRLDKGYNEGEWVYN